MHYQAALTAYARNRFMSNFLPLLRRGKGLRRVVSVFGGTYEGVVDMADFQGWGLGRMAGQGYEASITTLALEEHREAAPEVAFVHCFPGAVESGIGRGEIGGLMRVLKTIYAVLGSLVHVPLVEAGERHLFLCMSARFGVGGR